MQIGNEEAGARRIAMWSGPRNISTALMRAWENRADTMLVDEPFYAFYLQATGADHPGADEVIAHGETDWRKVVHRLTSENIAPARIFYQKQMTHHLPPEIDRNWLAQVTNCFLIRDPAEVIASYLRKNHEPTAGDLGFPQQAEIYDYVCAQTGQAPPIIDAADVLRAPERTLRRLCEKLEVPFSARMLSWPPGPRTSDGVWAKHWYAEVERSTGFAPHRESPVDLPPNLRAVEAECRRHYERLSPLRLQ